MMKAVVLDVESTGKGRSSCACPHCGTLCDRDEVDVEVGVMQGPWGCGHCGWSECPEYDSRDGVRRDGAERVFDQYDGSHHVDRPDGREGLKLASLILTLFEGGHPSPLHRLSAAAEVISASREPWWRWTCHLAAAVAARQHGIRPQ